MNNEINHNPANDPETPFRPVAAAKLTEDTEGHRRQGTRRRGEAGSDTTVQMPPVDDADDTEGHRWLGGSRR